jgi:hypothetical protein
MRIALTTSVAAALLAGGCAWVKLEPGAQAVRVARAGEDLAACQRAGEIAVSVRDKVGFYARDDLKVRDELETLARNEADSLRADTIQPLGPPQAGEQRFAGYRCGAATKAAAAAAPDAAARPAPQRGMAERLPPVEERSNDPATEPLRDAPRPSQGFEPIDEDG